jgi:hypothetical protein
MKKIWKALFTVVIASVFLPVAFAGTAASASETPVTPRDKHASPLKIEKNKEVLMLTYFRQRYPTRVEIDSTGKIVEIPLPDPMLISKLHIALSTDGRHWVPLNGNKPVWDQFARDPYIRRGPDGLWRVLSTGSGKGYDRKNLGPDCLYMTSKDLVHWKQEGTLSLMKEVRDASGAFVAQNIWAPEWYYDQAKGEYLLFWSSSFQDAGWKESRLWCCRTKDWKTFTPAKVFFEPPYSVIDGTLLKNGKTYYLFHKEEEFGARTGERRAIRVATSSGIEGPWTILEGPLNKGQIVPVITEGPASIKDPLKPGWLLYYDYCMADRFGVSYSPDLTHWEIVEDAVFPPDARHGSVTTIKPDEAEILLKTYGTE